MSEYRASQLVNREAFLAFFCSPPKRYSEQFPDVPAPDTLLSPEILAARWIAGDLHPEDMAALAADLLEAGCDTPALCRLAGEMGVSRSSDIAELVAQVFRELEVEFPIPERSAKIMLTRQIARQVIFGQRNAWQTARYLLRLWDWKGNPIELYELDEALDAIDIEPAWRPSPEALNLEIISIFARLSATSWSGDPLTA